MCLCVCVYNTLVKLYYENVYVSPVFGRTCRLLHPKIEFAVTDRKKRKEIGICAVVFLRLEYMRLLRVEQVGFLDS